MSGYASPNNTYQWNDANGPISGETTSEITITTSGSYSLTVTTPAGCTATSSALAVSVISLSAPSGLSASNIQLTKATMNWNAVANADHYDIRLRAQGSSTWTTLMLNLPFTSQVKTGLSPSTTYEWQVRAACSSDSSSVSSWSSPIATFTTLTPCTSPLNATTTSIGLTSAILTWDVVSSAWGYRVRYKETSQPWSCLLYTSPSPRDRTRSRMPSSA